MRKQSFLFVLALAGLVNGCGGGQTKPADPNSQQQHRCGPGQRCLDIIGDEPAATPNNSQVVTHD